MTKSAVMHKRTTIEEIKLSGIITDDGLAMLLDGEEKELAEYLQKFAGRCVDVSLKEKTEEIIDDSENAD